MELLNKPLLLLLLATLFSAFGYLFGKLIEGKLKKKEKDDDEEKARQDERRKYYLKYIEGLASLEHYLSNMIMFKELDLGDDYREKHGEEFLKVLDNQRIMHGYESLIFSEKALALRKEWDDTIQKTFGALSNIKGDIKTGNYMIQKCAEYRKKFIKLTEEEFGQRTSN
jgi:hypothetical protein